MVGRDVTYQLSDGSKGSGPVGGVTFEATGPMLDVDGVSVPLVNVISVNAAAGTTGTTTGTTTGGTTAS